MKPRPLLGSTIEELEALAEDIGLPRYAASQISGWIYRRGVRSFEEMTNLSKRAREALAEGYVLGGADPRGLAESSDGTKKYLFPTETGDLVETVYIPDEDRATLCVSTQVGCSRRCSFCVTGTQGLRGNLSAGDILNQYLRLPERERVSNLVFMGMGEPMDNLDALLKALEILTSQATLAMSPTRITVSTVGVLPALEVFLGASKCRVAWSLHTPFPQERERIMPVEKSHPLEEVLAVLRADPAAESRRISVEYILFAGLNDDEAHARQLVRMLHGTEFRVNLIRHNPAPGIPFEASSKAQTEWFQQRLRRSGIVATIRKSRGLDIAAACGLLSTSLDD